MKKLNPDDPNVNKDDSVATLQLQVWHLTGCISWLMWDSLTRAQRQEVSDITGAQYVRSVEHKLEYLVRINYNFHLLNILKNKVLSVDVCLLWFVSDPLLSDCLWTTWMIWRQSEVEASWREQREAWGKSVEIPFFRLQLCLWGSYGGKHMERGSNLVPFAQQS